jgi:hypothetical protein
VGTPLASVGPELLRAIPVDRDANYLIDLQWARNHCMCSLGEAANAATAKLLKNIEMKWSRIDLSKSTHQLLTSDRPIDMPLGLADPEAYISLPVSPRILFVLPRPESTYNDCVPIV